MGTLPSVVVTAKHSANFNFWAAWIQVPRNSILSSVLFRALGKLAHCQVSVFMRSVFFLHPAYSRFPVVHSPIDNKTAASSMHESFESLILRKSSKVLFIYLQLFVFLNQLIQIVCDVTLISSHVRSRHVIYSSIRKFIMSFQCSVLLRAHETYGLSSITLQTWFIVMLQTFAKLDT